MKFKEVLEHAGIGDDEKARRVRNVSDARAKITAEEIERGVTLERLESIGVPVFRYSTQVTIHGKIPDFNPAATPAGYCSIFANGNGSLGVRYVAIDAEKKDIVVRAARRSAGIWRTYMNSTGLEVVGFFEEKEACQQAYRNFPKELFYGSVTAAAGMLGGYYVVASVGAIRAEHLWRFVGNLWGIDSAEALAGLEKKEEERRAAAEVQRKADLAVHQAALEAKRRSVADALPNARLTALPKAAGSFVRVSMTTLGAAPVLYVLAKRGPGLCYATQPYTGQASFVPVGKMKRFDEDRRRRLESDLAKGFLFVP